jgi:hypothetical protein
MKNTGLNALPQVKGHMISLTLNLAVIALLYAAAGLVVSRVLRVLFLDYSDEWEKNPRWFQVMDVSMEMVLLVIASFWITYMIRYVIPVFPLNPSLETYVEQYSGIIMFYYAVFLFFGDLDDKLIYLVKSINQTSSANRE